MIRGRARYIPFNQSCPCLKQILFASNKVVFATEILVVTATTPVLAANKRVEVMKKRVFMTNTVVGAMKKHVFMTNTVV